MSTIKAANLMITGPSGAGKSPLGSFVDVDLEIEPHRVRKKPRNEFHAGAPDVYYLSPMAYEGLLGILEGSGELHPLAPDRSTGINVYRGKALTFSVRSKPQVLFLPKELKAARRRKIEIYAPILLELLKCSDPARLLEGDIFILLLNPWNKPIDMLSSDKISDTDSEDGQVVAEILKKRGETDEEIRRRIACLPEELEAWQAIMKMAASEPRLNFVDARAWEHAEYTYRGDFAGRAQLAFQTLMSLAEKELPNPICDVFTGFFSLQKAGFPSRKDAALQIWNDIALLVDRVKAFREGATGTHGDTKDHWDEVLAGLGKANYKCSVPHNVD